MRGVSHIQKVNTSPIESIGQSQQKPIQCATINNSRFLALPLDAQKLTQQLNLQLLSKEKLTKVDDVTSELVGTGSTQGIEPAVLTQCFDVGIQLYFDLVFILWTRTVIVIEFSLLLKPQLSGAQPCPYDNGNRATSP